MMVKDLFIILNASNLILVCYLVKTYFGTDLDLYLAMSHGFCLEDDNTRLIK